MPIRGLCTIVIIAQSGLMFTNDRGIFYSICLYDCDCTELEILYSNNVEGHFHSSLNIFICLSIKVRNLGRFLESPPPPLITTIQMGGEGGFRNPPEICFPLPTRILLSMVTDKRIEESVILNMERKFNSLSTRVSFPKYINIKHDI